MNKNQNTKHQIPKTQKGITLVALVITIIVLLILAVVAIRAIQKDSIINYAKNSVDEYERAGANEQSLLQGYIGKIEEYTSESINWIEIAGENNLLFMVEEGKASIIGIEPGYAVYANMVYRVYVESPAYTGSVIVESVDSGDGTYCWYFFIDDNGKIVTISSFDEVFMYMEGLVDGSIKGELWTNTMDGLTIVTSIGKKTDTYKVTKIEWQIEGTKIFEGSVGNYTEIDGLNINLRNNYMIIFKLDGKKMNCITTADYDTFFSWKGLGGVQYNGIDWAVFMGTNRLMVIPHIMDSSTSSVEIEINAIYDLGNSNKYVEENGFAALKQDDGKWCLFTTPNTEYVVPETIEGVTIDYVNVSTLSGTPTFSRPVTLVCNVTYEGGTSSFSDMIITTSDISWMQSWEITDENVISFVNIDMTQCGDEIVIPENLLTSGINIYVTSTAKTNLYSSYDNVTTK